MMRRISVLFLSVLFVLSGASVCYASEYTLPDEFNFLLADDVVPVSYLDPGHTTQYLKPKSSFPLSSYDGCYYFYCDRFFTLGSSSSATFSGLLTSSGNIVPFAFYESWSLLHTGTSDGSQVFCIVRRPTYDPSSYKAGIMFNTFVSSFFYLGYDYEYFYDGNYYHMPLHFVCSDVRDWYPGLTLKESTRASGVSLEESSKFSSFDGMYGNNLWSYDISSVDCEISGHGSLNVPGIFNEFIKFTDESLPYVTYGLNGNGILSPGTYSVTFDLYAGSEYGAGELSLSVLSGSDVVGTEDVSLANGDHQSVTVDFTLEDSVSLTSISFRIAQKFYSDCTFFFTVSSSSYTEGTGGGTGGSGSGSGGGDMSAVTGAIGGMRKDMNTGFSNVQDSIDKSASQVSGAVEQAAGEVSGAVEQAAGEISGAVSSAAESVNEANESIAESQEALAESRHDELVNGYDASDDQAARGSVQSVVDEYGSVESEAYDSVSSTLSDFEFTPADEVLTGQMSEAIIMVKDWLQLLYESLGDFQTVFIIFCSVGLALMFVGYYKFQKGG